MSKAWNLIQGLRRDENGAALIEYTVLLGILLVAVIATIGLVGVLGAYRRRLSVLALVEDAPPNDNLLDHRTPLDDLLVVGARGIPHAPSIRPVRIRMQ